MAEKLTFIDEPLRQLDLQSFGITDESEVCKLRKIADTLTMSEEKSFASSVLDVVNQWRGEYPFVPNLAPNWLQESAENEPVSEIADDYVIFRGDARAIIIYDVNFYTPMHANWQCPQQVGGKLVWAVFRSPSSTASKKCLACDPGTGVWHDDPNYLKRCDVDGKCREWYDDGTPIPNSNSMPCSYLY